MRNIPSGEERGETDVFAGYEALMVYNPLFFVKGLNPGVILFPFTLHRSPLSERLEQAKVG